MTISYVRNSGIRMREVVMVSSNSWQLHTHKNEQTVNVNAVTCNMPIYLVIVLTIVISEKKMTTRTAC